MDKFNQIYMPTLICGRGSISFATSLGKKRVAVLGYDDSVKELAKTIFASSDTEICYIATVNHEPVINDIFDNLDYITKFAPDLILAIGGGSVMDVAKGLHLFYENPDLDFRDALTPFSLPQLGKKAISIFVPTTSGTGSEASSAAVFVDPKTKVKNLLLSNTLIPHYAVLDADFTDKLPLSVQISTGLDALCHAIESATAKNANTFTKAIAKEAAIDILEQLPVIADARSPKTDQLKSKEILHIAATMAGIAITNSFTGIVHSYDHPGPTFHIPHGITCGIMLPYSMKLIGPHEEYAAISKRLGYTGTSAELTDSLINHILTVSEKLGIPSCFRNQGIDETLYFENVPEWSRISLSAGATHFSPANMDFDKGQLFYKMCYYGF